MRGHTQMQNFKDVIDECSFIDLGFEGPKFTWSKHFTDGHSIWERLERGLVNSEFLLKYPTSKVSHLSVCHQTMYLFLSTFQVWRIHLGKRCFVLRRCGYLIHAVVKQWKRHGGMERKVTF